MKWAIYYHSESVERAILKLPDGLLARYLRLTEVMQAYGPDVGMPHTRALGGNLYELRLKSKEGIARVFYCKVVHHKIIMLHSFIKKTEKIPLKELRIARKRLQESE